VELQIPNPINVIPAVVCPYQPPAVVPFHGQEALSFAGRRDHLAIARFWVPCVRDACPLYVAGEKNSDGSWLRKPLCKKEGLQLDFPDNRPAPEPEGGEAKAA